MSILGIRVGRAAHARSGAEDLRRRRRGLPRQTARRSAAVIAQMVQYFTAVTADRRAHPDFVGDRERAVPGRRLDDAGTIGYYAIVATAGHDDLEHAGRRASRR